MASPDHHLVKTRIAAIEAEMKVARLWQTEPLPPTAMNFKKAFGMDTMSFDQWLQFVFVPRVNHIVETNGQFPAKSMVGAQAVREFDGNNEAAHLVHLLCEFDAMFR